MATTEGPRGPHADDVERLQRENAELRERFRVVSELGMELSTTLDPVGLLPRIVTAARRFTRSEAGSLYVKRRIDGKDRLVFEVAQNDRLEAQGRASVAPTGVQLPIDGSSLAGLAAFEKRNLVIDDAAHHPSLSTSARDAFGYEVETMLVVPLIDHRGDVLGVLQLMNALDDEGGIVTYSEASAWLCGLLASHAATAMEVAGLHAELEQVFHSLVRYTTSAIDARDPSTAGHSSRVGFFAREVAREMGGFSDAELEEIRFAGLFHDVGKIGVRESVLAKGDKLTAPEMAAVEARFLAAGQSFIAAAASPEEAERARAEAARLLSEELPFLERIKAPGWLEDEDVARLERLRATRFRDHAGREHALLTEEEHEKLGVRKGNLTAAERREIMKHVDHSHRFLSKVPFPAPLAGIPEICWSHHEKMDGSGYPRGLAGEAIPRAARVLAVVDVFDALTAKDRPYKKATPPRRAMEIIEKEAGTGAWDPEVVAALRRLIEAGKLVSRRRLAEEEQQEGSLERETW